MKKLLIFLLFLLICAGCSPSNRKFEEAIQLTQQAMPTYTLTQLPISTETPVPTITLTPTIEISHTSEVPHIIGLSHEDVLQKYLENGFTCGEWEINDEGNYEQSCTGSGFSSVPDSIIIAEISGRSEDTVFGYFIIFTPFNTFDSWDDLEKLLKILVDFGQEPELNLAWIDEVFVKIKNSEDFVENREYYDIEIILISTNSVVSLLVHE
jgi:hypothetical protein